MVLRKSAHTCCAGSGPLLQRICVTDPQTQGSEVYALFIEPQIYDKKHVLLVNMF